MLVEQLILSEALLRVRNSREYPSPQPAGKVVVDAYTMGEITDQEQSLQLIAELLGQLAKLRGGSEDERKAEHAQGIAG